MKVIRKIITIDETRCDGCGLCVPSCAEGALAIIDGKAKIIAEKFCDGLGACIGECPKHALTIVEKEVDEFDEQAVESYLANQNKQHDHVETMCPSSKIMEFKPLQTIHHHESNHADQPVKSELTHWPIKIRLVPSNAPFLKHANLLILADCCAVAYANLHQTFIKDKVVLMGCPKFDNSQAYTKKLKEIFETMPIKSITIAMMDVPCCAGLLMIVKNGLTAANVDIPIEQFIINFHEL